MKLFLKKLFLFATLFFLVALIIQTGISFRIKGKTVTGHDNLEQTSDVNANLVFLGSSRCWQHFDPVFFDTTFKLKSVNIGIDGHSEIQMVIVRLKDYLSRNKPPLWAILNFDPLVSGKDSIETPNFIHKNNFARYSFFPKSKDSLILNYFKFDIFEKYIPLYSIFKYKELGDCLLMNNISSYAKYGYEMHPEKWDTIANPITNKWKENVAGYEKKLPSIINSLRELNKICIENNIKLLCIQTPVYKTIQNDTVYNNTKNVCKDLNIAFIDTDKKFIRDDINNFANTTHLNKTGVQKMNEILKMDTTLRIFLRR